MKTYLSIIIAIILLFSVPAFSQLKVNSSGKVNIGADPGYSYNLQVAGISGNSGLYAVAPGVFSGSVYGVYGKVNNPSSGSINRGYMAMHIIPQ